jgi:hypothetical protein
MKYLFTFIISILFVPILLAQVEERPLENNFFLIEKTWEVEQAKAARIKAIELQNSSAASERGGKTGIFLDTFYIVSGQTLKFEIDTKTYDTILVEKPNLTFGKASSKNNEVTYVSKPNVKIGFDTLQVFLCDKTGVGKCDTQCYFMTVKRANQLVKMPLTVLKAEKDTTLCITLKDFTGKITKKSLTDVDNYSIARDEYVISDSCVYYLASRLGGADAVYFNVKDENEVLDTFVFPIKVLQDTLSAAKSLFFMDDFSYYKDGYPNRTKWLDDRAYINNGMSPNPPSIGFATFDGVSATGRAYGGAYGVSDVLTSAYLDVSAPAAGKLYLSFYLQPKGLGYPPREVDSFLLEYKNADNKWKTILGLPGIGGFASDTVPKYKFYSFEIGKDWQYKGFQFRFKAYGTRTGVNGIWNLDYVRISQDFPSAGANNAAPFKDISFANVAPKVLKKYTAMPLSQLKGFEDKELSDTVAYTLFNHFGNTENITNSEASFQEITSGKVLANNYAFVNSLNIPAGNNAAKFLMATPIKDDFYSNVKSLNNTKEAIFKTEYSIKLNSQQNTNYDVVVKNDTVTTFTKCSDYYAYDDASAESVFGASGNDSQAAVKFTANKDDILSAVAFHFPLFNKDNSLQKFNLRVFIGSLKDKPDFEQLYLNPVYAYTKGGGVLNGFTIYELLDANKQKVNLKIPKGDFYVGWQQVSAAIEPVLVGFDKNNPQASSNIFANSIGVWKAVGKSTKGALMIRPIMGTEKIVSNEDNGRNIVEFSIAPNPAYNVLYINDLEKESTNYEYSIYTMEGKIVEKNKLEDQINIENLTNGVYLLRLRDNSSGKANVKKFIVLK